MVLIDRRNNSIYVALLMSIVFHLIGFTSFLLVLPLLYYFVRTKERDKTLIALVLLLIVVLISEVFPFRNNLSEDGVLGLLSIGLFLPVALIGCSIVWILLDDYRLLVRYLASSAVVALLMIIISFIFKTNVKMAQAVDQAIIETLNLVLNQDTQETSILLGVPTTELFSTIRLVIFSMLLPLGAGCFGFNAFFALSTPTYVGDESFDERVKNWKLPEIFMWLFLISFVILLLGVYIDFPISISVINLNIALYLSLLFALQALSIILYRSRAKGRHTKAVRVFGWALFLVLLFQGLNIVAVIGLPIFGITETWFTYRK